MGSSYPFGVDGVWIGRDANGCVAAFITAGEGVIPEWALVQVVGERDVESELLDMEPRCDADLHVICPRPESFLELGRRGLHVYDWQDVHAPSNERTGEYMLVASPKLPLHVDELPPSLKQFILSQKGTLPGVGSARLLINGIAPHDANK